MGHQRKKNRCLAHKKIPAKVVQNCEKFTLDNFEKKKFFLSPQSCWVSPHLPSNSITITVSFLNFYEIWFFSILSSTFWMNVDLSQSTLTRVPFKICFECWVILVAFLPSQCIHGIVVAFSIFMYIIFIIIFLSATAFSLL